MPGVPNLPPAVPHIQIPHHAKRHPSPPHPRLMAVLAQPVPQGAAVASVPAVLTPGRLTVSQAMLPAMMQAAAPC